jgi:NAD(P)-dependent dehydrogenase (short-subunit alcohol dehydrogenase family)
VDTEKLTKTWDFTAQTIVIPGGAGILGSEMALALVKCGAKVVILDRDLSKAEAIKERFREGPGSGSLIHADVLSKDSLVKAREIIKGEFGKVHALINAAGGNMPAATTGPDRTFFDLPAETLKQVVDLNLEGSILPSQIFGRMMVDQGEGIILNISSMSAYRPLTRVVGYSAAKAAVTNFTQWLAVHMAQEYSPKIRVNAIAPGFFHTTQNHYLLYDEKTGALTPRGKSIIDHTPMKRFGVPEDLLGAVLWLLSPASEFVTGAVIAIDGGFSAFSGV